MKGYLVLENGEIFEGETIGYQKESICEIVFNTSMTGYLEIFTDPSYAGQGVVMTYPLIGNYGLTQEDQESKKPWVEAVFVHEIAEIESNFRSKLHINDFLKQNGIPGLQGINTRKLTKVLRQKGTMKGKITTDITNIEKIVEEIKRYEITNLVEKVSSNEHVVYGNGKIKIALLDFGAKQNIINSLVKRGCEVTVFPQQTQAQEILSKNFHAIVLSNGPGNPEDCEVAIKNIKELYKSDKPILGICLGHQLMGLATGAKTCRLKYGHRGPNHPVKDVMTGRVSITSQNHGYVIEEDSINKDIAEISHINLNDGTIEGLRYKGKNILTVQYHPEACPGPEDSRYIFDDFIEIIKKIEENNL
ncbi:MAG: carbamoyl phosphate synthase small subunit [Clostridia bacterium]|jgi:carbamoyl-phosphate synthase small subunit|nr:carbamoyl phosphate synthase small subunit [Clostridia bacterium]